MSTNGPDDIDVRLEICGKKCKNCNLGDMQFWEIPCPDNEDEMIIPVPFESMDWDLLYGKYRTKSKGIIHLKKSFELYPCDFRTYLKDIFFYLWTGKGEEFRHSIYYDSLPKTVGEIAERMIVEQIIKNSRINDQKIQKIFPISSIGNDIITVPTRGRRCDDFLCVLSSNEKILIESKSSISNSPNINRVSRKAFNQLIKSLRIDDSIDGGALVISLLRKKLIISIGYGKNEMNKISEDEWVDRVKELYKQSYAAWVIS